jgi:glycosyltransferase involved in cell wall biosynthesis
MAQRLNIAMVQVGDARNVRTNSGTLYFSKQAFQGHVGDVTDLTPAPISLLPYRAASKLGRYITGKWAPFEFAPSLSKRIGAYFSRLLKQGEYDLVYSPCSAPTVAYLETDVPIIYYSDITWHVARNYYGYYTNVLPQLDRSAEELERRALERASIILLPSHWAAESAVRDYGIDPGKIHVPYLGANLIDPPSRADVLPKKLGTTIRLLLVGVDWEIKGGQIALDTLTELLAMGYDAELTVVGCHAPKGVAHPRLRVIPFLNKQVPEERALFERLWREADFFIFPTRFEAAGLVLCEASAHALPAIAAHTGGVPSLLREGRNGYTVASEAGGSRYAEIIASLADDPERYAALCQSSREEFETRLNWDSWGEGVARKVAARFPHLQEQILVREESYNLPLPPQTD